MSEPLYLKVKLSQEELEDLKQGKTIQKPSGIKLADMLHIFLEISPEEAK